MSVEPEETEVVICEACGATNAAHNQICTRCEAPLVAAPVEPERTANSAPHLELTEQEQIRGCGEYLWVAMTIVGLAIILLVGLADSGLKIADSGGMYTVWLGLLSCVIGIIVAAVAYAVWKMWG